MKIKKPINNQDNAFETLLFNNLSKNLLSVTIQDLLPFALQLNHSTFIFISQEKQGGAIKRPLPFYFFTLNILRKIGANILGDFISTIFIIKAPC